MSAAAIERVDRTGPPRLDELPTTTLGARAPGWWGMVGFIATEASLFGCLLFAYYYISVSQPDFPPAPAPSLRLPSIMTALLVASSVAVMWGERGIRRGEQARLRIGLLVGMLLGVAFLVLQGLEYHEHLKHMTPQTDAYASLFYTITSVHGAHVLTGVLLLAWLQLRAWSGHFTEQRHLAVQNIGMYWHFVDVVWLVIIATLYVGPHLH